MPSSILFQHIQASLIRLAPPNCTTRCMQHPVLLSGQFGMHAWTGKPGKTQMNFATGDVGCEGIALVPVLDLLDHSPAAHVAWHTGASGTDPFQFITHSGAQQVRLFTLALNRPLHGGMCLLSCNRSVLLQRLCQLLHALMTPRSALSWDDAGVENLK